MYGLAPHTQKIFENVSRMKCIEPYLLVGGTALSLQIKHRLSEDLDFMSWKKQKTDVNEVDWVGIMKELSTIGAIEKKDIWDFNHAEFIVDGVKFSFYACDKYSPEQHSMQLLNNVFLASVDAIAAMKMEVMLRRANFRDYYDIYSILKFKEQQGNPSGIKQLIEKAVKYSGHRLSTKNIVAMLSRGERFKTDSGFKNLAPKYEISPLEIEEYLKAEIKKSFTQELPKQRRMKL